MKSSIVVKKVMNHLSPLIENLECTKRKVHSPKKYDQHSISMRFQNGYWPDLKIISSCSGGRLH